MIREHLSEWEEADFGYYLNRDTAAHWDESNVTGEHVASGIYVLKLVAGEFSAIKRMTILK